MRWGCERDAALAGRLGGGALDRVHQLDGALGGFVVTELHLREKGHRFVTLGVRAGTGMISIGPGGVGNEIDQRSADRLAVRVPSKEG